MSVGTSPTRQHFNVVHSPFAEGVSLVEASAGTGKTFNIAMSVIRLLLEERAPNVPLVDRVGNILVVTFTVAATDELVARIRTMLRWADEVYQGRPTGAPYATGQLLRQLAAGREALAKARITAALAELDTLAVFTIHGFCKRILDEFALESGTAFGAALLEDDQELLVGAMQDWWRRRFYDDAALAGYAVTHGWGPTTFAEDFALWSRFPDVTVDPAPSIDSARDAVQHAVADFAAVWNEDTFRALVADIQWTKDAPCGNADALADLMRQATAAVAGDLGAAEMIGRSLGVEALQEVAGKRSNADKAKRAAIAEWPIAMAASSLAVALTTFEQAVRMDCFAQVRHAMQEEKRRRNALGFDDLLERLSRALQVQGPNGLLATAIRSQFHAALIDEFQDTDLHQFRIFETAFAGKPLFLIGDPKQAIYAFRGADVHAYLAAVHRANPQFTLGENFRSTPRMVNAVNAIFAQRAEPFVEPAIGFVPATAASNEGTPVTLEGTHALQWLFVEPEERKGKMGVTGTRQSAQLLMSACVRHIAKQITNGWKPRSIAVLVRTTREGVVMADALRECGIPAVVSGMGNVLQSEELAELHAMLEAMASPRHDARVRGAMATHLWGSTADDVLRISSPGHEAEWDAAIAMLTELRDLWVSHGFLQMVQTLFLQRRVAERLMAYDDGDRRLTNLRHAVELLHHATVSQSLNIEGLLRWVASRRADSAREREVSELRLETDADAVQILTIHKSKGLQFDLVYCPSMFRAYPTNPKQSLLVHEGDGVVFDQGSSQRDVRLQQAEVERLAEDCRLTYVALTRARFRTYVGWGAIGTTSGKAAGAWNSALAYLVSTHPGLDELPVADRPAAVADWFKSDCLRYEQDVRALVAQHPTLMAIEVVDTVTPGERVQPTATAKTPTVTARTLPADVPLRTRFDTYAVTSFTGLTAGAHEVVTHATRDVDDVRVNTTVSVRDLPPSDFRTFPAGRRAGTLLHTLFEHSRFDDSADVLRERVTSQLLRNDIAATSDDPRIGGVVQMMDAVFRAPMPALQVALRDVAPAQARHEWEFLLPFADADHAFTRQAIAAAFEQHGGASGQRYAAQLRQLGGARIHGFLTGFVDLVFVHQDRWYVVDWKSNQLGAEPLAYAHEALRDVMDAQHYTLQYHLYLVALHRFLAARLPSYDFDQHIGGAAYAFLRGFAPDASAQGHGWFTDRPSRTLIEALSAIMDRRSAGRAE
ncbi:exodeoxyribonuclease V subunit beta [Gemmatimonas sp.]|jgi:exodeoxyribonuclease V beta subunit|uniref:exodeoxyribonuclease V subunit beta n=1 Tax=Gemmatimonas sp. TaxID=1962908 RepID=UPI0037C18873